ncbi:MAG: NYN domain-containing protein [bacterium]|nr:NYN domain-containing protein [bacterium]
MKNRTIVYVDGFNLFYGALRGTSEAWLDLERLFRLLLPHDDLRRVRFFSALMMGHERIAQRTHLRALETTPLVEVTLGRFKTRRVRCRVAGCSMAGPRRFAWPEEKRTDVTIGITMVDDAYQDECDRLILVSGDSDLVPALALIRKRFPEKEIVVYVPARHPDRGAAVELRGAAHRARLLPLQVLKHAQFPDVVIDARGRRIRKPADWNSRA